MPLAFGPWQASSRIRPQDGSSEVSALVAFLVFASFPRCCPIDSPSGERGRLVGWPGPDPVELADGSLVVSATAPRAGVVVVRAVGEIDLLTAPA